MYKNMNKLIIEQCENGWILSHEEPDENGVIKIEKQLVVDEDDNKVGMTELLTKVAEHFGYCYDKWSENNLSITWNNRGHKLQD
jgi:hypothetical protein